MSWLDYLTEEGFLSPEQNPEPEAIPNGFVVPRWESLGYVLKLSAGFDGETDPQTIDKVIKIITDISNNPRDNYHTWYTCIKILCNLPNEKIPLSILDFIPAWLGGRFDTMLQSSELINVLLPKFVSEAPSEDDILKAEKIVGHLFDIRKHHDADPVAKPGGSYVSRIYTYYLKELVTKVDIKQRFVQHMKLSFLYTLADLLNRLARDFAAAAELKEGDIPYTIFCVPEDEDLQLVVRLREDNSTIGKIENYRLLERAALASKLETKLDEAGINNSESRQAAIETLCQNLYSDVMSFFGTNAIGDLHEETHHGDELIYMFAYVFREFLQELARARPADAKKFLNDVLGRQVYQIPLFRRMALYVIAGSWRDLKHIFFTMIQDGDSQGCFSDYKVESELDYLLRAVQSELDTGESAKILAIIEAGPKDDEYPEDLRRWQLRWFSVLNDHPVFVARYNELAHELGLQDVDIPKRGRPQVTVGPNAPFSVAEIQDMDADSLLRNIREFRDGNGFREPSAEGFAENIMKVAEKDPARLVGSVLAQNEIPPVYVYYLFLGLTKAWKDHLAFDWETVLNFCKRNIAGGGEGHQYTSSARSFKWEWLISVTGRLLSEGLRDNNEFDERLMPLAKDILLSLGDKLEYEEMRSDPVKADYVGYSLNSNAGPVLRAALDYSLRQYRIAQAHGVIVTWECKDVFAASFEKGIIDTYVLVGMYLPQFYLLDNEWTETRVREFINLENKKWKAFVGGLSFAAPAWNKEIYLLLYSHYERSLAGKEPVDTKYHHGIIRHLTAYYLWDYENSENSLLDKLIHNSHPENMKELIQFLRQQTAYLDDLSAEEQENTRRKAIDLWKKIADEAERSVEQEEIFSKLIYLSKYLNRLDDEIVLLLMKSIQYVKDYSSSSGILTTLARLKDVPCPAENAPRIARIMEALPFNDYLSEDQQELVKVLVTFLFEQGQKATAQYICNKLAINGYTFLRDTYDRYRGY